jgi:DNA polymerase III gamma/tau subunit
MLNHFVKGNHIRFIATGSAGSGKTSVLRVMLSEYYGERPPIGAILRLDPNSDIGVSQLRSQLETFCHTSPPAGWNKKRTVVADNVDELSPAIQQAIRACMDRYGSTTHFMMACTQPRKVPIVLKNRAWMITCPSAHLKELQELQKKVCKAEGLVLDKPAARFVVNASFGSIRVLLQYLDKLTLWGGHVTLPIAQQCCSVVHPERLDQFLAASKSDSTGYSGTRVLYSLYDDGFSVMDIIDACFTHVMTSNIEDSLAYNVIEILAEGVLRFHQVHENEITLASVARSVSKVLAHQD